MSPKTDVWQGALAVMVLKTPEGLGRLHGYAIARRIEPTSGHLLSVNCGTLHSLRVGACREQSPRQVSPADPRRSPPTRQGSAQLGAGYRHRGAVAETCPVRSNEAQAEGGNS
jgi:hypothetical protein